MDTLIARDLARLDRLPQWPWSRGLLANLGGSFFFAFFDIVVIGSALPSIDKDFGITAQQGGYAVTIGLIGLVLGSFAGAYIATKRSRVAALKSALWIFSLGMLLCVVAPNLWWLLIARFITGFGTGADISVVVTYVAEISPARARGRITGFTTVCGYAGIAITPFLALALTTHLTWGWRLLFAFGAVGGLVVVMTRRHIPQSPRLLAERGQTEELGALVDQAEATLVARGVELPPVTDAPVAAPSVAARASILAIAVFTVAWFLYYIGNYGWLTLAPTILGEHGFSTTASLGSMAIANLGLVLGAVLAYLSADRFERKWLLLGVLVVWGLALCGIGVIGTAAAVSALGFVAALTIGLAVPIFYAFTAEHFPSHERPWGMAWTDGVGHLGGAIAPMLLLGLGLTAAFVAMGVSGFLAALLLVFSSRTKDRSLEEITGG